MTWSYRNAALGLVASSLVFVAGCSVYDASLLPSEDCRGRRPPGPPQDVVDGDDGNEYVVVLRDIFIDQGAGPDEDPADAPWRRTGYNFDAHCTSVDSPATECQPVREDGSPQPDGLEGIDNTFGNQFFPIVNLAQPGIDVALRESQEAGIGAVLLLISGWNGEQNDPRVTVAITQTVFGTPSNPDGTCPTDLVIIGTEPFLADGITPAPPPNWDGEDCFWLRDDNFIGGNRDLPNVLVTNAHVTDGEVVGFVPDGTEINLFGIDVGVKVKMSDMLATGDIYDALALGMTDPPPVVTVAGRWGFNDIQRTAENVGICPGTSQFNITTRTLEGMLDLQLDPSTPPDTSVPCDALSVGTTFNGYLGYVGGITVGQVLPNDCVASP